MRTTTQSKSRMHMQRRDFQRMDKVKPGATLSCAAGILWVTQSGDRRDYILRQDDSVMLTSRGKVLIEAVNDAEFTLA